jgi:hypothetical protein
MTSKAVYLLLLALTPLWLHQAAAQPPPRSQPAPSTTLEIPVRIALAPLYRALERAVPTQVGDPRRWQDAHGVKAQYQAWRGPLYFRLHGDVLVVQTHVRYWIKARKRVLKALKLDGSCGVNEPPRQALIGVALRLGWRPDWTLQPQFRILPTRFLDRCEMTLAGIDVTPVVGKAFERRLRAGMRSALRSLTPRLNAVRELAEALWRRLQAPLPLGEDNWLSLRPAGVALSPLYGRDAHLETHLAMVLYPKLVGGPKPASEPGPLPPLGRFYPRSSGLHLRLAVDLDFDTLSHRISTALAGRSFDIMGQRVEVATIEVGGAQQGIRVKAWLSGDLAGTAEVRARLAFDTEEQALRARDLEFSYHAEDPAVTQLAELFPLTIRQALADAANRLLAQRLGQWRTRLGSALEGITPQPFRLDMDSLRFRSVTILLGQDGIRLEGVAAGSARIEPR